MNEYAWEKDKEFCEENGRMDTADASRISKVSAKASKRVLSQINSYPRWGQSLCIRNKVTVFKNLVKWNNQIVFTTLVNKSVPGYTWLIESVDDYREHFKFS
eukprot:798241_1